METPLARLPDAASRGWPGRDAPLAELSTPALLRMAEAGRAVLETTRMLARSGQTVAGTLGAQAGGGALAGGIQAGGIQAGGIQVGGIQAGGTQAGGIQAAGPVRRACQAGWHTPTVADAATGARFMFHRLADAPAEEAGHFHCFVQPDRAEQPAERPAPFRPLHRGNGLAHIVGVAVDRHGLPIALFTTNRWVTDETWQPAARMRRLADRFAVNAPGPAMAAGIWLSAMLRLFRAEIAELLDARDAALAALLADPEARARAADPFEDRALAEPSRLAISVETQIARLRTELAARR